VRVLRIAAAEWRKRAQRVAPAAFCLLWLVGCATTPTDPVRVTEGVNLPHALVSDACEEGHTQDALVMFEHAEVLYSGDIPWALDCGLYDFDIADHRRVLVDFRRSTAAVDRMRHYLVTNGLPVPPMLSAGGI
jgi:hypothetical protein